MLELILLPVAWLILVCLEGRLIPIAPPVAMPGPAFDIISLWKMVLALSEKYGSR